MKEKIALLLALTLMSARSVTAATAHDDGTDAGPIAVLSMFSQGVLPTLIAAGAAHKALGKVPVYIGQYGISEEHARLVHELPNGRYAPIFTPRRKDHPKRRLSSADLAKLSKSAKEYDGPIPENLLAHSSDNQRMWGVELGRRLRDGIRAAIGAGVKIDSWQFDEISPTPAGKLTPRGVASRWFISGALHGLAYGRPELGDKRMKGLVFIAQPGRFGELPDTPDARIVMWELDHVALAIMGEEYPNFEGDPQATARRWARGQLALRAAGGVRARLAARYLPAMTPGYTIVNKDGKPSSLGGNVDGRSDAWVNDWREAFIAERVHIGTAGLGEYSFARNNTRPAVIRATVSAVADGIARLLRRVAPSTLVAKL